MDITYKSEHSCPCTYQTEPDSDRNRPWELIHPLLAISWVMTVKIASLISLSSIAVCLSRGFSADRPMFRWFCPIYRTTNPRKEIDTGLLFAHPGSAASDQLQQCPGEVAALREMIRLAAWRTKQDNCMLVVCRAQPIDCTYVACPDFQIWSRIWVDLVIKRREMDRMSSLTPILPPRVLAANLNYGFPGTGVKSIWQLRFLISLFRLKGLYLSLVTKGTKNLFIGGRQMQRGRLRL